MLASSNITRVRIFQIGDLVYNTEVRNAILLANQTQRAFNFTFEDEKFPLDEKFKLSNGGYNIDEAIPLDMRNIAADKPIIFITSQPYSDKYSENDPEGYFFSQLGGKQYTFGVLSTYLWKNFNSDRRIQPYILFHLACVAFDLCANFSYHDETRGCPFDYCDTPNDIDRAMQNPSLCHECSKIMATAIKRGGRNILEQVVAAKRLLNRAIGKKLVFVAMPFKDAMKPVFEVVRETLEEHGWEVVRADHVEHHPRNIIDTIIYLILASDLIIAEVTKANPNVFYELGWAFATDQDVVLLTQGKKIPFDVNTERAIIYTQDETGMKHLAEKLVKAVGISVE